MASQTQSPEYARALAENVRYAAAFDRPHLELPPARRFAVLACMDARLTVEDVLGLRTGDAHIYAAPVVWRPTMRSARSSSASSCSGPTR